MHLKNITITKVFSLFVYYYIIRLHLSFVCLEESKQKNEIRLFDIHR